ncbi:GGDEF domain-containing protein [Cellulomonas endophytica]|uniref:GGDEF domain-containing protein n=1 Tax=Cellulomonas endophytica TaxID=2494735 RepID=UPI00101282DD|nr:GGDEF domain-containing protein [Cellulomonas endophytica]
MPLRPEASGGPEHPAPPRARRALRLPAGHRGVLAVAAVVLVPAAVLLLAHGGRGALVVAVTDVLEVLAAGAATVLLAARSRRAAPDGPVLAPAPAPTADVLRRARLERRAWALLALACGCWTAGQVVWTWFEVVLGRAVPFPSLADAGFLGFPAFSVLGALALATARVRMRLGARTVLDGLLVGGAVTVLSWDLVLQDVFLAGGDRLGLAIALAYPLGDAAVLAIALLLLGRSPADTGLHLLATGLVALAVADSAFVWSTTNGSFATGGAVDVAWLAAFALLAAAGAAPDVRPRGDGGRERPARLSLLVPYVPVVLGLGLFLAEGWQGDHLGRVRTLGGLGLVLVLVARQGLTVLDNAALLREVREGEERLRVLAYTDALTGLANRGALMDALTDAVGSAAPRDGSVMVAYVDLDGFKEVNDTLGHTAGDRFLVAVAERLRAAARPGELVARLGGDEFAVLVDGAPVTGGTRAADAVADGPGAEAELAARVRRALGGVVHVDGVTVPVRASVGVARTPARGPLDEVLEGLMRSADAAMYRDKAAARSRA